MSVAPQTEADEALALEFPPGTLVTLKSGGPPMTVSGTQNGKVWTSHWESQTDFMALRPSQTIQSRSWHPNMLIKKDDA